jgi:lipid-binding SYLF domain-containing protein
MSQTTWEKTKGYSKQGFDKVWNTLDKVGGPMNRLSYRMGAEAFWPMTLDKECDKAARILRSFCKEGFYADIEDDREPEVDIDGKLSRPKGKQRVLQQIPSKVIQQAKGLAIFTTMRTGLWIGSSGGSGVLIGRIPETGEWSPPSGIMPNTVNAGLLAGADIYDCVLVINTYEALEAFKTVRCTLGGEISASAGPVGVGGILESEVHKRQTPLWTYMKSRGFYGGAQADGTVIIERTDENERFYHDRISVTDILAGKIRRPPFEIRTLMQTVKAAQGDFDVDESLVVSPGQTPGDMELPNSIFGIPAADDPDPYGVKALEAEGLFIREAGTKVHPTQDAFEFKPSADTLRRLTMSTRGTRDSWRASVQSYTSIDRGTQTSEAAPTAPTSISRASSISNQGFDERVEPSAWDEGDSRLATVQRYPYKHSYDSAADHSLDEDDLEVHEVSSATVSKRGSLNNSVAPEAQTQTPLDLKRLSPTFTRARLVTIPKRPPPPPLPPRNPHRSHMSPSSPVSPVSSVSLGRRQSVVSGNSHTTRGVLSELPHSDDFSDLSAVEDSAVDTSYDERIAPQAYSTDKDGFESIPLDNGRSVNVMEEAKTDDAATPSSEIERVKTPVPA